MKRILTVIAAAAVCAGASAQMRLLVGTYTEGTSAEGVYLYSFDPASARTALLDVAPSGNPSFVIADGTRAWSVNEFNDGRQAVSAYSIGPESISLINTVPIPKADIDGEDPCNIFYTGSAVITSNYTGGTLTAFPVNADGSLGTMSQSYGERSHFKAHMHCAVPSPDGKYLFVTNLGWDCIQRFELKDGAQPLGPSTTVWQHIGLSKHYGPRHLIFSADGRFAYLLSELADKLVVFSYSDGTLTPIQTLTAYKGRGHGSADLHLSPDGRFLYTSHRLKNDGIAIFRVDPASGKVKRAGYQETGIHPRNFAISPDGRFLLCACRDSNRIEVYAIDSSTGSLSLLEDRSIAVGAPVCVQFVL